jgi:CheY-like chemotaxis protein
LMDVVGAHEQQPTNVRRLQPLRILLAGHDRRFMRVTAFLLSRRGYAVSRSSLADALQTAERQRADVVLIELDGSRVETGRVVAALQASAAAPALLLLGGNGPSDAWTGLSALYKWTPIDVLAGEIEAAALHRLPPASPLLAEGESSSP